MDTQGLDRFRRVLMEQRSALHLRLALAQRGPRIPHRNDAREAGDDERASDSAEATAILRRRDEDRLKAVNGALDQIDAGTYGQCRDCGQEISIERLEAEPWTRYCILCAELIHGHQEST